MLKQNLLNVINNEDFNWKFNQDSTNSVILTKGNLEIIIDGVDYSSSSKEECYCVRGYMSNEFLYKLFIVKEKDYVLFTAISSLFKRIREKNADTFSSLLQSLTYVRI